MKRRVSLWIAIALLSLAWRGAQAEIVNVSNAELQQLLDEGVPIVDVRRADEWQNTGVIANSTLLTFFDADGNYDAAAWQTALDAVASADQPVILICRSGVRSSRISDWLSKRQGYATVYNVTDGIIAWKKAGGKTVAP